MMSMPGCRLRIDVVARRVLRPILALALLAGPAAAAPSPAVAGSVLAPWTGSVSLYRDGVFTTQQSWLWCTAAGVQIARNIVHAEGDHSASGQRRYFDWMRARNRYDLPLSAGVDPDGWTAGMRRFVDDRYRLVSSDTFDDALRLAVKRIRLTGLPVALTVSRGGHGWLLTGFAASADPAATDDYQVTTVRIVGPLYGLQSKNGYDMRPNTQLATTQLRQYFTPWWYAPRRMVWDGKFVSIQPVPAESAQASASSPAPAPTSSPVPPSAPPVASPVAGLAHATPTASTGPMAVAAAPDVVRGRPLDDATGPPTVASTPDATSAAVSGDLRSLRAALVALAVAVVGLLAVGAALAAGQARRRAG
jgi:hypothetical protein